MYLKRNHLLQNIRYILEKYTLRRPFSSLITSACSCGGFLFARQAPSGGGYAGFVTGQRTKMAGKVL